MYILNIYNPKKDVHESTLTGVEIGYYNHQDIGLIFGHHGMIKDDKTVLSLRDNIIINIHLIVEL